VARTDPEALTAALAELERFNREQPDVIMAMVFHRFSNEAVLKVSDEQTAYPHRNIKMHMYVPILILLLPASTRGSCKDLLTSRLRP
jgi:hypothetical protein